VQGPFIRSFPLDVQSEVIGAYQSALRVVWEVCPPFNVLGFILVFFENEINMHTTIISDHKLKEKVKRVDEESKSDRPAHKEEQTSTGVACTIYTVPHTLIDGY
jgi:hypothetical protein